MCLIAAVLTACTPSSAEVRTRLLKTFPPGTAVTEIEQRLAADRADRRLDERRPSGGWSAHAHEVVAGRVLAVERRTKSQIHRCQYYEGNRGFSLLFLWFYYDVEDKLVEIDARLTD